MTEADNGQRKRSIQSTFSPWLLSLIMIYHRLPLVCLSGKEKEKVSAWAERIQRNNDISELELFVLNIYF